MVVGDAVLEPLISEAIQANLARFKHPRRLEFVADLPRNAMGKVQKAALRQQYSGG